MGRKGNDKKGWDLREGKGLGWDINEMIGLGIKEWDRNGEEWGGMGKGGE